MRPGDNPIAVRGHAAWWSAAEEDTCHRLVPRPPADLNDSRCGRACLDITSLSPRHVLEATAGDVERLVYRHMGILVATVQFVALARCWSGCRVQRRFVIDNHVLSRQRQLDSNLERPTTSSMPVPYFKQYSTPDDPGMERFEPLHARTNLFLEGRGDAHVAKTDLNGSCRHGRGPYVWAQQMSSHSSIFESWKDCTMIRLSTWAIPGAFAAARSAESRCSQVPTVPVRVAVLPDTVTVM